MCFYSRHWGKRELKAMRLWKYDDEIFLKRRDFRGVYNASALEKIGSEKSSRGMCSFACSFYGIITRFATMCHGRTSQPRRSSAVHTAHQALRTPSQNQRTRLLPAPCLATPSHQHTNALIPTNQLIHNDEWHCALGKEFM